MTFRQFAVNNVLRNIRIYIGHYLSSTFAVMIFFIYGLLAFHPNMQGNLTEVSATLNTFGRIGFQVSQYITYFFSIFFVLYSVSAFLKKRKIEFGILTLLGLSPRQLNKLIFTENILIGFASIITGVGLGLILTKLILLMSASVLAIGNSLPFYFPVKAMLITSIAFSILFILVSFFISRTVKVSELVELIKSKEKPLPEPKSSVWLALLAVVLIGLGYMSVFYFAGDARHHLSGTQMTSLLIGGVVLVVAGTYYLFTQLSVYVLKIMKKNTNLYFKKTNLLTFSELTYRMKENARTFFLVSIISAAAFTAIGTSSAMGDVLQEELGSPYAITYESYDENTSEVEHIAEIGRQLDKAGFDYIHVSPTYMWQTFKPSEDDEINRTSMLAIRLSDYNEDARALGYPEETFADDQTSIVIQQVRANRDELPLGDSIQYEHGSNWITLKIDRIMADPYLSRQYNKVIVITDVLYERLFEQSVASLESTDRIDNIESTEHGFIIDNWEDTIAVSEQIAAALDYDINSYDSSFNMTFLSINWQQMKELNGVLSILTVLIGIVFFVFACSFLYFRLFTDLDKDREQYQMLSKIGLSIKELKKIVVNQMGLLFFLPMAVAIIHSSIAFVALQLLLKSEFTSFTVLQSSIVVLGSFLGLQLIYFFLMRRNYLRQLYRAM